MGGGRDSSKEAFVTGHVIHLNTTIDASPEAIWDVVTDVAQMAQILRSVKSAELLTEGEYAVGTTWREERTFFGHHGTEELHVTECDAPRRTLVETTLGRDKIRTAYSIQPHRDRLTRLLVTAAVDMHERSQASRLIWNTWGNVSFEATKKMLQQDLEDIQKEVERRSGDLATPRYG
jgi:carbon monoxide dehydrogenase subunit G